MTDEEKFSFDLEGYLVVRNVLDAGDLTRLNAAAERAVPDWGDSGISTAGRVSQWGAEFQALMDHVLIVPYLVELLGPKFRIDHDYCIFMKRGATRGGLHGGETDKEADHWYKYRDGVMRNGLTVVTYFLSSARAGDGGFACIPGSHKSNFVDRVPPDVRRFERDAHYVVQPEVDAGDALIFTEAIIHGTKPWTADHDRRALLYKYSPGHSAWSQGYYDPEEYADLTEQQRRLMAPPSVGRRPDTVGLASD